MSILAFNSTLTMSTLAAAATICNLTPAQQLSQDIFRLAADPDPSAQSIAATEQIQGQLEGLELGLLHNKDLNDGDDPSARARALVEVGSREKPLEALLSKQAPDLRVLDIKTPQLATRESEVLGLWQTGLSNSIADSSHDISVLEQARYIIHSLTHFFGFPAAAVTGIIAGLTQDPATAVAFFTFLASALHRYRSTNHMLKTADDSALTPEQIQAYLNTFELSPGSLGRLRKIEVSQSCEDQSVVAALLKSAGATFSTPELSKAAFRRGLLDFLNLSTIGTMGFEKDPGGRYYDRAAQAIGLGVMQRLQWQPIVLNDHRLDELRELQATGARIVFLANHRSHLDTLVSVSLLRDFAPRFVAKAELGNLPGLGWAAFPNPFHAARNSLIRGAGSMLIRRADKKIALDLLTKWMGEKFAANTEEETEANAIFAFPEETRLGTPDRNRELGMRPYRPGLFIAANEWANELTAAHDIHFVPLTYYGVGRIFPKSNSQTAGEGGLLNQQSVISIGAPISVKQARAAAGAVDNRVFIDRLNQAVWWEHWQQIAAIQAYMNEHSPRIADYEVVKTA